jgi:hypothetical protein
MGKMSAVVTMAIKHRNKLGNEKTKRAEKGTKKGMLEIKKI